MLRYKTALLIIMLLMISLACSVSLSKDKGNQDSAPIEAQSQPQTAGTPRLDYNVPIRTEVISPVGFLSLAKNYSFTETTTGLSRTLVVLENNSTDPQDIITDFEGKMTWFNKSNQVIDEIEVIGFGTNIFPQEKQ